MVSKALTLLLILAALVRIIYLCEYSRSYEWDNITMDSRFHHQWAVSVSEGDLMGEDVYIRGPFYIYVLGLLYAVFGPSIVVGRILGMVIGLLSIVLTYLIAREVFNRKIAVIAAAIHAFYPVAIYFESELLVDGLFTLLAQLSIFLFLRALNGKRTFWFVLTGVVIGLAAITRPVILGLAPLFIAWLLFARYPLKEAFRHCTALLVAVVVVVAPVTLRNVVIGGDLVLVSSAAGINFYIGNNSSSDGLSASMPSPLGNRWEMRDVKALAEEETGQKLSWSEVSSFWSSKAWTWIRENKGDFAGLYLKKVYHILNNYEASNNRQLAPFFDRIVLLKYNVLCFGLVFSSAVMAVVLLGIQRRLSKEHLFLLAFVLLYLLGISFFFVNARFRFPVVPLIVIFSAAGVYSLIESLSSRKWSRPLVMAVMLGGLAGYLSFSNLYGISKDSSVADYYYMANRYSDQNQPSMAIDSYHEVLKRDDRYPGTNLRLGSQFFKLGKPDSAEYYIARELQHYPDNAKAHATLASLCLQERRYEQARQAAGRAVNLRPDMDDLYAVYIRSLGAVRDQGELYRVSVTVEDDLDKKIALFFEIGQVYGAWGVNDSAITYFKKVISSEPDDVETREWIIGYLDATYRDPDRVKAHAAFSVGSLYSERKTLDSLIKYNRIAISLDSNLTEAYMNLITGLVHTNRRNEARSVISAARRRFPGNDVFVKMERSL